MEDISPKYKTLIADEEIIIPPATQSNLGDTVGGFKVNAQELTQGKVTIQGIAERILIGSATAPLTGIGIFMGSDQAATVGYDFRIGDPAGSYIHWDASAATLTIVGLITATSGTIGGFSIGADYIRDAADSFGLASTVTGGDDVRFWAGDTFANRATAPFRVTEAGVVTSTNNNIAKFGGAGGDGALSISSGTTTISAAGARYVEKNYTSISITGTGVLAFSNPHAEGTTIMLRSQGAVTVTSSATRAIDLRSMGAAGGAIGTAGRGATVGNESVSNRGKGPGGGFSAYTFIAGATVHGAGGGGGGSGATGTVGSKGSSNTFQGQGGNTILGVSPAINYAESGGGGAAGSDATETSGVASAGAAGGIGGGGLVINCNGAYNATGTFGAEGTVGDASSNTTADGGGGGGGAGGNILILYTSLTADSATYTCTGGAGGSGNTGGAGGAGATGAVYRGINTFIA